jgi:hypothetical protein
MNRYERSYHKEEEFLDEFYNWASSAAVALNGEWKPNYSCDDNERRQRDDFMKRGELAWLVFVLANVACDETDEMYAQIVLESSTRAVKVKVWERDGKTVTQVVDRVKQVVSDKTF